MIVREGGAWRTITEGFIRVNGAWRRITEIRGHVSDAWETLAALVPPLSVSQDPAIVGANIQGPGEATTNPVTAVPEGGEGPFSYAWTSIGGATGTINSPTSATTTFTRTLTNGDTASETFRCTVTDSFGSIASVDVDVIFSSNFIGGEG